GSIGLELGSVWARLGSDVTIVELLPKIAAGFDDDIVRAFSRLLQRQGLKIETGARVTGLRTGGGQAVLLAEREGKPLEFPAEKVLVAVGRRPYTDGLGLENAGASLHEARPGPRGGGVRRRWGERERGGRGPYRLGSRAGRRVYRSRGRLRGAWRGHSEGQVDPRKRGQVQLCRQWPRARE